MSHGDLGLHDLRALAILLDERNVTRSAVRFHLSQPSMSRTLQRLRAVFDDELMVRSGGDYALTPRGRELQGELAVLLPRLEGLVSGRGFDPSTATGVVRLIGTDYTTATLGPVLLPRLARAAPDLEVRIEPRDQDSYADLERGRADVALSVLRPAAPLRWERLFTDDLVCVVDRDHPVRDRFSVTDYVAARHVAVAVVGGDQPMIERWLQALGQTRRIAVRVAYFSSVAAPLHGTDLVATIPRRMTEAQAGAFPWVRVVEAPEGFDAIPYGMVWHPRLEADPMHCWLRDELRAAGRSIA
ncbi:LysR family transcriptional regulator [Actinomycetospora straminea]|uniref:LysR family transcriptional regulator n=1 Tax=Actinomycetospora straminea TaxID=663607 RepID=A0ABP9EXB3_9PSEU|nr:LysR family transcriptional regulator [Actinomycetospora straminea]MDD7931869.1 LysR family transcriptional regulator [Actinomycetospora straminea]